MRPVRKIVGLLVLVTVMIIGGCRKGPSTSGKQIKKGKPIPCPLKDC